MSIEDNKLIDEFMGKFNLTKVKFLGYNVKVGRGNKRIEASKLVPYTSPYNSQWDLLMSVVEKICKIGPYDIDIHSWTCEYIDTSDIKDKLVCRSMYPNREKSMIEIVYETTVKFIKLYNLTNKPNTP